QRARRTSWTPPAWPTRSSAGRRSSGSATATPTRRWSPRPGSTCSSAGCRCRSTRHCPGSGPSACLDAAQARLRLQPGFDALAPEAVRDTLDEGAVQPADQLRVLAGQRVERAVGEQDLVVLDARLVALVGERLGQKRPVAVGPS